MSSNYSRHSDAKRRKIEGVFQVNKGDFDRPCVDVSEAEIVGYFSLDGDRNYLENSSNLSYYKPPNKSQNVSFDLNHGMENVRRKAASADDEQLSMILKWIKLNYAQIKACDRAEKQIWPDFVCFRGLLTTIFCTPYESKEPWIICAAKWRGTIYLCAYKTEEKKEYRANMPPQHLKFMSWGFKFEKYLLADSPDEAPNAKAPVNEAEEFCCMFERRLGSHTILYGAEMDGVKSTKKLEDPLPLKDLKFVEVKTSKAPETYGQKITFRKYKILKWWAQSYFVGIDDIVCGFRDNEGIVNDIRTYSLSEIVKDGKEYWNPNCCLNFCDAFLSYVKHTVVLDCDKMIYKFENLPYNGIVTKEICSSKSEYNFIDPAFLNEVFATGSSETDERDEGKTKTKLKM